MDEGNKEDAAFRKGNVPNGYGSRGDGERCTSRGCQLRPTTFAVVVLRHLSRGFEKYVHDMAHDLLISKSSLSFVLRTTHPRGRTLASALPLLISPSVVDKVRQPAILWVCCNLTGATVCRTVHATTPNALSGDWRHPDLAGRVPPFWFWLGLA